MENSSEKMTETADAETLDKLVAESRKFLENLKSALVHGLKDQSNAVAPWFRELSQVERKDKRPRIIIGVVGATGSGKSSIINAILGEKQLVPTNCMRACTAVVTEISYHDGEADEYRAVVEFVSASEWRQELKHLMNDLVTGGRVSGNIRDDTTEAGIAFAKVQAVYPHLHQGDLQQTAVEELLSTDYVKDIVGTEVVLNESSAEALHTKIQSYVDSKEKIRADFASHGLSASSMLDEIAYWPLVRKVRIYTKSPVLETGAVLVDLPGVADSNAARASIAQKYLQNCAALWVVAPIIRAVDDKSARYLLGEAFKRQLFRDGTLQRLTFICSKTDEMTVREARATLTKYPGYREKFEAIDQELDKAISQRDTLQRSRADVQLKIEKAANAHKELLQEDQEYQNLQRRLKVGDTVHPLMRVELVKRKLDGTTPMPLTSPPKKARLERATSKMVESPEKIVAATPQPREPEITFREDVTKPKMTVDNLKQKLHKFKLDKRAARAIKAELRRSELELKQKIQENKALVEDITARQWSACVLGRNELSASAIRNDFSAGLRDLEQDEQDGDDEVDYDSGVVVDSQFQRDETSLPVFCVSAKGYYKLSGDGVGEKIDAHFMSVDDTGVPALQEHAWKLGLDKKLISLQAFVDASRSFLTSLRIWSSGGTPSDNLSSVFKESDDVFYTDLTEKFVASVLELATETIDKVDHCITSELVNSLQKASQSACQAAISVVEKWIAPRNSTNPTPGLAWNTFRAVVRRDGLYAKPLKKHDFNSDLLEAYMRRIDKPWHNVFNVEVDQIFRKTIKTGAQRLDAFAKPFGERLEHTAGPESSARKVFEEQIALFTKAVGSTFRTARNGLEEQQKEANRLFESCVRNQMRGVYAELADMSGIGSFVLMKERITTYVEQNKQALYHKVSKKVRNHLQSMTVEIRRVLLEELGTSCDSLRRDCKNICQQTRDFEALPEDARNAILKVLDDAESGLAQALVPPVTTKTEPDLAEEDSIGVLPETLRPLLSLERSTTPLVAVADTEGYWSCTTSDSEDEEEETEYEDE